MDYSIFWMIEMTCVSWENEIESKRSRNVIEEINGRQDNIRAYEEIIGNFRAGQ